MVVLIVWLRSGLSLGFLLMWFNMVFVLLMFLYILCVVVLVWCWVCFLMVLNMVCSGLLIIGMVDRLVLIMIVKIGLGLVIV